MSPISNVTGSIVRLLYYNLSICIEWLRSLHFSENSVFTGKLLLLMNSQLRSVKIGALGLFWRANRLTSTVYLRVAARGPSVVITEAAADIVSESACFTWHADNECCPSWHGNAAKGRIWVDRYAVGIFNYLLPTIQCFDWGMEVGEISELQMNYMAFLITYFALRERELKDI